MRLFRPALLVALVAAAAAPAAAAAQASPVTGTFELVADESDDINEAINQAMSGMNFAVRQIARPRLRRTNQPYRRVTIESTGSRVNITTDQRAPIGTTIDGVPVEWTREDNEVLDVSTRVEADRLHQVFAAEDGQRENVYSLSADGRTLILDVTVTSGRLPRPLQYRLVYRRS